MSLRPRIVVLFAAFLLVALAQLPANAAGIYAHYSFDSGYTDVSYHGRDGSLVDVGTIGNSGIITTAGDYKFGGGAFDVAADRDYVAVPSTTFSSGNSYTISFWARKADGDTGDPAIWDMIIGQRSSTNHFIGLLGTNENLRWRGAGTTADRQFDFPSPNDTIWHHYAVVANGTDLSFYRDGNFIQTATDIKTGFVYDTIGEAYPDSRDFDFHGQLDEVWIFDEALDARGIETLFAANSPVPEPSTLAMLAGLGLAALGMAIRRRRCASR